MQNIEVIKIPIVPPSPNKVLREHWAVRSKRRKKYSLIVTSEMNKHKFKKAEPKQPFKLNIFCYRKRLLDFDNLYGSVKSLLDACCDSLFIWDDDNRHLKNLEVKQRTIKEANVKEEYTLISRMYG